MIAKLRLWEAWFPLSLPGRRHPSASPKVVDASCYAGLALDIAMSAKLNETLPFALEMIQSQLKHTLEADVFLVLPEPLNEEVSIYHSPSVSPPLGLVNQLHYHYSSGRFDEQQSYVHQLPGVNVTVHAEALDAGTNQPAWLLLILSGAVNNSALICQQTALFKEQLSRGLVAWQHQQTAIQSAITAERKVNAAELHDSMAQVLAYMRMRTAKLASMCDDSRYHPLKEVADDLSIQAHGAYRQARELIASSRLSMQGCSLKESINKAVQEFEARSGIVFEIDNRTASGSLMCSAGDIQILFIVREALSNIVRHSRASHARVVMLNDQQQNLIIRVEDNGKGICLKNARSDSFGLKIMQERAQRIDAKLQIRPRDGEGTRVQLTIPKRESA